MNKLNERFGEYELLEKIAVGGMAELFKARSVHGQGVEKIVVIKRIHPAMSADPNFVAMFIDEARLSVSLVHGNIVPVFDFGHYDGHYYLVMEFVEGHDLAVLNGRAKVVHKPWPLELSLLVTSEILRGLEYAHNKKDSKGRTLKLVHRDISPSNILISTDGEVKILDFGIARSLSREFETRTGVIKGKPGYMAPEQAAGHKVDSRADIWSVGAVLHELVTGEKLKNGRLMTEDAEVDKILDKSLAADPGARYSSAQNFRFALDDLVHERGLRPSATTVAQWANDVTSASSPSADWTMRSSDAEEHMAAVKEKQHEKTPLTINLHQDSGAPTTQVLSLKPNIKYRTAMAIAGAILLSVLAFWFYDFSEADEPQVKGPPPSPTPPIELAVINANCEPAGASISINKKSTGKFCPATIETAPGPLEISVAMAGYLSQTKSVVVSPGVAFDLDVKLESESGSFSIDASPKGALVLVDGEVAGQVPIQNTPLLAGPHTIEIKARGYVPQKRTVEIETGQRLNLRFMLQRSVPVTVEPQKAEPSFLTINSQPWSEVTLDGKSIGNTPIRNFKVLPGKHVVELKNPFSKLSKRLEINVAAGETERVIEKLQ